MARFPDNQKMICRQYLIIKKRAGGDLRPGLTRCGESVSRLSSGNGSRLSQKPRSCRAPRLFDAWWKPDLSPNNETENPQRLEPLANRRSVALACRN